MSCCSPAASTKTNSCSSLRCWSTAFANRRTVFFPITFAVVSISAISLLFPHLVKIPSLQVRCHSFLLVRFNRDPRPSKVNWTNQIKMTENDKVRAKNVKKYRISHFYENCKLQQCIHACRKKTQIHAVFDKSMQFSKPILRFGRR